jgi:hypothetical protein
MGVPSQKVRLLPHGILAACLGFAIYAGCVMVAPVAHLIIGHSAADGFLGQLIWWSGLPVIIGIVLAAIDLFVLLPSKRQQNRVRLDIPKNSSLTVVLTAYNDEQSIGLAVADFLQHPRVARVIVVDNNSRDSTAEVARASGAHVVCEEKPGYGRCVYRALQEGQTALDTELTLLCEGDMTFRAYDIDKFLAYLPHSEIVNGTRIVEQLRERNTQLTTFMYYGNFFVGKLLEAKHIGRGTFTDVGTTYKLCRNEALGRLLPLLDPSINLEFNAHFLDTALTNDFRLIECPVTFHNRVGESKGGNTSDMRALKVGMRMIAGIVFGWGPLRENA